MLVKNRAEKNSSKEPTKGNKTLFISISYPTSSPHCTVSTTYIFSLLRRFVQLNQCGFHGVSSRPYKDLGQVELNDGRLILDGLGQSSSQEQVLFLSMRSHNVAVCESILRRPLKIIWEIMYTTKISWGKCPILTPIRVRPH